MNVDDTVRRSLMCYPSLHTGRPDVLDHILGGYGTGYDWAGGELVCDYPFPDPNRDFGAHKDTDEDNPVVREVYAQMYQRRRDRAAWVHANIDTLVAADGPVYYRVIGDTVHRRDHELYSPVHRVPDDITPDWAAAVAWWHQADANRLMPDLRPAQPFLDRW